jgi:ABC-2 type transport system ATP-binding protein
VSEPVIRVSNLVIEYKSRNAERVRAVDGISFEVNQAECVGFIGPNGAGKSSTIKTLMGFQFPSAGTAELFGLPAGDARSRARLGYLPEVTLYYQFMKGRELLQLYGGLHGLSRVELRERIPRILHTVGLDGKGEDLIRTYSKGMQQRLGIAQSIIADPECLIFDELSSGLDPVGRNDLREVLLDLKNRGRTIFFSSHELHEVEALCDRIVVINKGKIADQRNVKDLIASVGPGHLEEYFMELIRPAGASRP